MQAMKTQVTLLFLSLIFFAAGVCPSSLPPDFDLDYEFLHDPPGGLSAGWAGKDVYISWNRVKDKNGNYATGYRLYRAAGRDSAFAQVDTEDGDNLIFSASYFDTEEALEEAGVIPWKKFSYKVTAVVIEDGVLYESHFSAHVSIRDSPGCFIATAAYGTPMAGEVAALSSFRDSFLVGSSTGRTFACLYETLSPPAAEIITSSSPLRRLVRMHVSPLVRAIRVLGFK